MDKKEIDVDIKSFDVYNKEFKNVLIDIVKLFMENNKEYRKNEEELFNELFIKYYLKYLNY